MAEDGKGAGERWEKDCWKMLDFTETVEGEWNSDKHKCSKVSRL